ncbi:hypothetical protein TWF481_007620 [Arthrobotrys musiformis]|uniref:Alpha-ketoglutarate-dependent dioxygenase AlkB-like domain-containing protein n=1 Tax=Arthrobotrys musiformis TaxID=47236 RepID=A0AAV9WDK2_9PEZI
MAIDRKGSRSSRRLQGEEPEPLSPPRSEEGEDPPDIPPRQARIQRVSVRNLNALVSPPLLASESNQDASAPGSVGTPNPTGKGTRKRISAVEQNQSPLEATPNEAMTTKPTRGSRAGLGAPARRSGRLSKTNPVDESVDSKQGMAKPPSKGTSKAPSKKVTIASLINNETLPPSLPLPSRGLITKRRSTNQSYTLANDPNTTNPGEPLQTRPSKRKAETASGTYEPAKPKTKDSVEEIQIPGVKRRKLGSTKIKAPKRSQGAAEAIIANSLEDQVAKNTKGTTRKNSKHIQIPAAPTPEKPPAIGRPTVWCDTRQELCESLPYFRSYQSGCYATKGIGRGYLIDGHASERDYMDGCVIISHAGGNSEEIEGERRLVRDQTWDKGVISCLRNNYEQMVPLIVIIGDRCPTAPAHLERRYAVMDWFKVTHCWPEVESKSGNIRCKFRLERLDSSDKGWWAAEDTPKVSANIAIEYINCPDCRKNSPWIYDKEPMCLNKDCKRFWTVHSGKAGKSPERFVYRESFLHGKTVWPDAATVPPGPFGPSLPIQDEITESHGRDIRRKFWKGMWCQSCGKLNCRELWRSWKCTNCHWEFVPKRSHFVPADLSDQHRPEYTGPPVPENVVDASIKSESLVLPDGRRAMMYDVFQCGKVIHILANKVWNALPGGSDWLLDKYQDLDMPFKRHELKTHKLTGRLLTQQFSFNSGAPYKYIVEVDSLSFEKSPAVVQQALNNIQADVTRMIPDALPMNEVLNVAYFEEQKMDFHDDGEEDLGPCVSSISLGSPAMMYFRVKAKYCNGVLSTTDKALLQPSNPSQSDSSAPEGTKRPSKRNILELRLHHGDVVIMNGRAIQRLLEHAVTPEGFRIAATARNISSYNVAVNSKELKRSKTSERKDVAATMVRESSLEGESESERPAGPNQHALGNLSIPTISTILENGNARGNQIEMPTALGISPLSISAPSPTSALSTPNFTYYNINAASATPFQSSSVFHGGSAVHEEAISPLTISRPTVGNYSFEHNSREATTSTSSAEPRALIGKTMGMISHPGATGVQPYQSMGQSLGLALHNEGGVSGPPLEPSFNSSGYGGQGFNDSAVVTDESEGSGLPGWTNEQFERLQNIFLSNTDTSYEKMEEV